MGDARILDAIAVTFLGIEGLNDEAIYAAGIGEFAQIQGLPDEIADGPLPATVVLGGDKDIIPGSWERTTWSVEAGIWLPNTPPRAEAYRSLLELEPRVRQAFRERAKAGDIDPAVQSVLITQTGRVENRRWSPGDNKPWYLVLPISIEVKVSRQATYQAR